MNWRMKLKFWFLVLAVVPLPSPPLLSHSSSSNLSLSPYLSPKNPHYLLLFLSAPLFAALLGFRPFFLPYPPSSSTYQTMMQPAAGGMAAPPMDPQQQSHPQQYQQYQNPQQYMMMPHQAQQPPQMWQQQPQVTAAHGQMPAQTGQSAAGTDEVRTLWIGDLQYWMDETYLSGCFAGSPEVANVKVIRNKQTMQSDGYGFIEFYTRAAAERALQTLNGAIMPNGGQSFRLNWASAGGEKRSADDSPDYTLFVGDLASDVTDYMLQEMFRGRYPSVKGAKVVMDRLTGRTKGYGFVKFTDESEQMRAINEMNGVPLSTRPMRIGLATNKKTVTGQQYPKASYQSSQPSQPESDPNNKTVFVGGLDPNVTDEYLKQVFGQYGEVVQVKIPLGKRCGFVQFGDRSSAEAALQGLQGSQLGGSNVRLSWGRSPSNKQPQQEQSQWNDGGAGYYGYTPGYENYGYAAATAAPAQDTNMYYGGGGGYAAAGYGTYQQQPPQQQQQPPQQQQVGYS